MPEICPFLAANHDPDSVLNYPSSANVCTKLGDSLPVANEHQAGYCLRARHWFCPVYTGEIKQPPTPIQFDDDPPTLPSRPVHARRSRPSPAQRISESRASLLLLALILLGAVGYGVWYSNNQPAASPITPSATSALISSDGPTVTSAPTLTDVPTDTLTNTVNPTMTASTTVTPSFTPTEVPTSTSTITTSPTSTATPDVTLKACQVPADWQSYTVAQGETYYHIAVKFGTTVDVLQRVNCLANPERLLAGQVISVPPTPATSTATKSS